MAVTNSWDESTPTGSDNASTTDDFFRKHRKDLGERLEPINYGFNTGDNNAPENAPGIKNLPFFKQDSDPSQVTDYGHFYVKLVSGVPELFYQDDTNTTLQLTQGGSLFAQQNIVFTDGRGLVVDTEDGSDNGRVKMSGGGAASAARGGVIQVFGNEHATNAGNVSFTPGTGGKITAETHVISDVVDPVADQDAATKKYVDDKDIDGTPTGVFVKFFTGTLDADASTSVAHGITGIDNILSLMVTVFSSGDSTYHVGGFREAVDADASFKYKYDGTNVIIDGVGADLQSQKYRIKLEYIL